MDLQSLIKRSILRNKDFYEMFFKINHYNSKVIFLLVFQLFSKVRAKSNFGNQTNLPLKKFYINLTVISFVFSVLIKNFALKAD